MNVIIYKARQAFKAASLEIAYRSKLREEKKGNKAFARKQFYESMDLLRGNAGKIVGQASAPKTIYDLMAMALLTKAVPFGFWKRRKLLKEISELAFKDNITVNPVRKAKEELAAGKKTAKHLSPKP